MPATRWGVYHNLRESEYVVSNTEITFFFSSEVYLNKFIDRYKNNRKTFTSDMVKKLEYNKLHLNMDTLADITLYKTIEKRGFFGILKGVEMNWEDLQKYALRKMTEKNINDWSRIPKPKLSERLKSLGGL